MIYLVEDDENIRELVVYTLKNQGLDAKGFERPSLFWKELEKDTAKKYAFVHNHNTDGMLSETDLQTMLSTEQVPVMIAVRNDAVKYIAERKGGILKTAYYDELYEEDIKKLNEKVKNGIITVAERTKEREVIIVENLLRDFTKGGKLIEQDGRK